MAWTLHEAIAYYKKLGAPGDQNAVVSLLREIQQENNGQIPSHLLQTIAEAYGIKNSFLLAVIKRIPSLRLADTHCLEICAGPNCGKQAALADFIEKILDAKSHKFTLKYVPCMRLCGKGPNIKWDGKLYHQADEALISQLIEEI